MDLEDRALLKAMSDCIVSIDITGSRGPERLGIMSTERSMTIRDRCHTRRSDGVPIASCGIRKLYICESYLVCHT